MADDPRVWVGLDPVASLDRLSLHISNDGKIPIAILSRREVLRLRHQIDRWLNWDRARQGTPRTYHMEAKDICHRTGRNRAATRSASILPESTNGGAK